MVVALFVFPKSCTLTIKYLENDKRMAKSHGHLEKNVKFTIHEENLKVQGRPVDFNETGQE